MVETSECSSIRNREDTYEKSNFCQKNQELDFDLV